MLKLLLAVVVAVLGAYFAFLQKHKEVKASLPPRGPFPLSSIPLVQQVPNPDKKTLAQLAEQGQTLSELASKHKPFVLRHAVDHWPAFSKWDEEYLTKQPIFFSDVFSKLDNFYMNFSPNNSLEKFLGVRRDYTKLQLPGPDFFSHVFNQISPSLYWAGDIKQLGNLNSDVEAQALFLPNSLENIVNLWTGSPGVTAHAHYDPFHNMFVQIVGRKHVTLFPPKDFNHLQLYPTQHPYRRQSMLNIENATLRDNKDDILGTMNPLQVTLEPGDLLYIPPFWFHHVYGFDASLSLNVWSKTIELKPVEEINQHHLSLGEEWDLKLSASVIRSFILQILKQINEDFPELLPDGSGHKKILRSLYRRFKLLPRKDFEKFTIEPVCTEEESAYPIIFNTNIQEQVKQISKELSPLSVYKVPFLIVLQDYFTKLAEKALGVENLPSFFLTCFPSEPVEW
eukprot:Lithocolla_globosa_v1_NODE_1252_length_2731_cov_28.184604.p1 type:complete len:453 gc:universal NODE_1252_length_2731_cov_28.184604:1273-2631(+)